jgi:2-polyprenyl-6-methoxyphenol hydroxylase-like FAD-dependent oxidoreductase
VVRGKHRAHWTFGDAGAELTPYPFVLVYPQDRHERLLIAHLEDAGVEVERAPSCSASSSTPTTCWRACAARTGEQTCEARWLAGCDGARSTVRQQLGAGFEGGTYDQPSTWPTSRSPAAAADGEIHLSLDDADFLALFLHRDGQARLIGSIRRRPPSRRTTPLRFEDVSQRASASMGLSRSSGELVLDLPRAPPRDRPLPPGPRVPGSATPPTSTARPAARA